MDKFVYEGIEFDVFCNCTPNHEWGKDSFEGHATTMVNGRGVGGGDNMCRKCGMFKWIILPYGYENMEELKGVKR